MHTVKTRALAGLWGVAQWATALYVLVGVAPVILSILQRDWWMVVFWVGMYALNIKLLVFTQERPW